MKIPTLSPIYRGDNCPERPCRANMAPIGAGTFAEIIHDPCGNVFRTVVANVNLWSSNKISQIIIISNKGCSIFHVMSTPDLCQPWLINCGGSSKQEFSWLLKWYPPQINSRVGLLIRGWHFTGKTRLKAGTSWNCVPKTTLTWWPVKELQTKTWSSHGETSMWIRDSSFTLHM